MRLLTDREEVAKERRFENERMIRNIHAALESVRFTGRMVFAHGQWCGIYGTPDDLKLRAPDGHFYRVEDA